MPGAEEPEGSPRGRQIQPCGRFVTSLAMVAGGKPKNASTAVLSGFGYIHLPRCRHTRICSSSCGIQPLKARDEHSEPLCEPRCRCREQRGKAVDAGGDLRGFPCLLRIRAWTLLRSRSRALAFAPRQPPRALKTALALAFQSLPLLLCWVVVELANSAHPYSRRQSSASFFGSGGLARLNRSFCLVVRSLKGASYPQRRAG